MGLENPIHILFIVLILLLLFGSARLPRLAKSLREAKDELNKGQAASEKPAVEAPLPQETPPPASPPDAPASSS